MSTLNVYPGDTNWSALVAAFATPSALAAGSRWYCTDLAGEVRRSAAGAWITNAVLGPYTFAELVAAYPVGGAAMAALPTGIRAHIVDATYGWDFEMVLNSGKTTWLPARSEQRIYFSDSHVTGTSNTTLQQLKSSGLLPASLLQMCSMIKVRAAYGRSGTTDATSANSCIKISTAVDTLGLTVRPIAAISVGRGSANEWYFYFPTATTVRQHGNVNNTGMVGGSGGATTHPYPAAGGTNTLPASIATTALAVNLCMLMATAVTDSPEADMLEVLLVA